MTKVLLFSLLIISWLPAFSQESGIVFFQGTVEELKKEASRKKQLIFIDVYTTWCGPCKRLVKETFPNDSVAAFYNAHFVNYSIDMEKGEGKTIRQKYGIAAVPTLLFIDSTGSLIHRGCGFLEPGPFIEMGRTALDSTANFCYYNKKYQAGLRDTTFLKTYAMLCYNAGIGFNADDYFKQLSDEKLMHTDQWVIMNAYANNISSREFLLILTRRDEFVEKLSFLQVNEKINRVLNQQIYFYTRNAKMDPEQAIDTVLSKIPIKDKKLLSLRTRMNYYLSISDVKNFVPAAVRFVETAGPSKLLPDELGTIVGYLATHCKDTVVIDKAIGWYLPLIKKDKENPGKMIVMGWLYVAKGDAENAANYADKAQGLLKGDLNYSSYTMLRQKIDAMKK